MDTRKYNNDQLKSIKALAYTLCRLIEGCEPDSYSTDDNYNSVYRLYSIADYTLLRRHLQPDITED